ncbi:AAA family ATPase [Pseudoclavibacter albus]|uniref:AAA family ATPase n=1 Tax=Pseudoclavibacter albus TaxID=272241 RepID=UPI000ADEECE6|nr:MoxR family ATPase [Pseudoclavibacter alba]
MTQPGQPAPQPSYPNASQQAPNQQYQQQGSAYPGQQAPQQQASQQMMGWPPQRQQEAPRAPQATNGATAAPQQVPVQRPERLTNAELAEARELLGGITRAYQRKVVGQDRLRESLLIALMTGGHILLESVPGLAKTTAAHALAEAVDASFKRIQCTPDLLPSDIVGTQIYDATQNAFTTQLGPVHANFVLLDEINRSSAKTQSAMLEAMQEKQTTIGGTVYELPSPFLVMATQNPIEQEGTYVLPEAQLDRFMLKDVLDYPTPVEEAEVLRRIDGGVFDESSEAVASLDDVRRLQRLTKRVYLDASITEYLVGISYVTRHAGQYLPPELARLVEVGASPRASINFSKAARALALLNGRDHVIPDDIRRLSHRILRHRVILGYEADAQGITPEDIIDAMFQAVRTP